MKEKEGRVKVNANEVIDKAKQCKESESERKDS